MMTEKGKYNLCVLGSEKDWWFNGTFKSNQGDWFIFFDDKLNQEVNIRWDKVLWYKELEDRGFRK